MITIHKTHTRNDLIQMAEHLPLNITYSKNDMKDDLKKKIDDIIKDNKSLCFKSLKYPEIRNISELLCYLKLDNPKRRMTSKEKDQIIALSKKVIHFCDMDFNVEMSEYQDTQEVVDDVNYIRQFGDLLSVRKACARYNEQSGIVKLEPILSLEKKEQIKKKKAKNQLKSRIKFERKHVIITFD